MAGRVPGFHTPLRMYIRLMSGHSQHQLDRGASECVETDLGQLSFHVRFQAHSETKEQLSGSTVDSHFTLRIISAEILCLL